MSATLVLTNGRIYTLDPARPFVTAVAIRDNQILDVGDDEDMKALLGRGGEWLDLQGKCVTPGLVDAHVHFQSYALLLQQLDLDGVPTVDEALRRIEAFAQKMTASMRPDAALPWLEGRGWNQAAWPDRAFPTAAQLDQVAGHLPVFLKHKSGHAGWANSRALRLAGIDTATPDPPGGHIQRDSEGRPTGILLEDAMDLVAAHIPRPTVAALAAAMRVAQERCWAAGLTGIHDFDGRLCFQALQTLREQGGLGLRVVKNIPQYRLEHAIGVGLRSGFGDDWLRLGGVKFFADGALGPRTAAMIDPYEGEPDNRGIVVTDKEELMLRASEAAAAGFSVTVHAIGDRANHDVLDVFEALRKQEIGDRRLEIDPSKIQNPKSKILRHRIEHVQVAHPADFARLSQLNVIASMQPIHSTSDMLMADRHWGQRAQYSYAWRSVLDTGALLVFGSDAPIEGIEPLPGIHAAVTRRRADGSPSPDGWYPEQKLTMAETIRTFTLAAAITAGTEARLGSITPGKLADLTIFDRDLYTIPPDEVLDVKVVGTMVDGRFKYRGW